MIQLSHICKNYKQKALIQDLSLTIEKNQLTSLIGPNGAGKSTLLNMMGRLIPADSGHISIDGHQLEDWNNRDLAKRLAILKQSNPLNLQLSVRDLVAFGRFPHSKGHLRGDDQLLIDQSLAFMNLEKLADKSIHQLSGGQLQRAYIAMILCQDTDYILLDEPLNSLDINHSIQLMNLIRRLVDEMDKTVVVVLHDINYASQFSDRIIAMKDGRLFANDQVDEVFEKSVVDELFDVDVEIIEHNLRKYCVYYGEACQHCINDEEDVRTFDRISQQ